jgi:hypothetical protein
MLRVARRKDLGVIWYFPDCHLVLGHIPHGPFALHCLSYHQLEEAVLNLERGEKGDEHKVKAVGITGYRLIGLIGF